MAKMIDCIGITLAQFHSSIRVTLWGNGTGGSLSPLLFDLIMYTLVETLRTTSWIKGTHADEAKYKTCLFADVLLMFLTDQETSPSFSNILKTSGDMSGYVHKSKQIRSLGSRQGKGWKLKSSSLRGLQVLLTG